MEVKSTLKDYFPSQDYLRRLGVCVFEAEANLAIHTTAGGNLQIVIFNNRVKVVAQDTGPGIRTSRRALSQFLQLHKWLNKLVSAMSWPK